METPQEIGGLLVVFEMLLLAWVAGIRNNSYEGVLFSWNETVLTRKLLLFECCEKNICEFLAPMFQKAGFQTHLVSSVAACMEAVRTTPPDAVLMITNNIWGGRAFAAAEAIRAVHPNCGFIFLAGSEEDGRESFLAAGYKFNVRRIPMSARELLAAASEAMDSPMGTFVIPKAG